MALPQYPPARSNAVVRYKDGTVQLFEISASHTIAGFLASEAQTTGLLVLRNDPAKCAVIIPVGNIQNVEITPVEPEPEPDAT